MDWLFWTIWAACVVIFILWVQRPIVEFIQLWKEHRDSQKFPPDDETTPEEPSRPTS